MPTAPSTSDVFRLVRGTPDDGELAALVTVLLLAARARPASRLEPAPWGNARWRPGAPLRAAEGAWRLSGLPY